jgi:hypothetical protein
MANGSGAVPEIVLQYRLRQLEKAEKLARETLKGVRASTELSKTERKERTALLQDQIQRLRVNKQNARRRLRQFQEGAGVDRLQDLFGRASRFRSGAEQAAVVAGLRGGSRLAAAGALVGGLTALTGPIGGLVALVVSTVEPLISAAVETIRVEFREDFDLLTRRFEQEIERAREAEPAVAFAKRLEEDPAFRRQVELNQLQASRAEVVEGDYPSEDGYLGSF